MPPVTTTSTSPARIIESAISIARIDDAQTLLIVSRGRLDRQAGLDRRLARRRLPRAALQHLAHDHVLRLVRLDADPLERGADHDAAELGRLVAGEPAAELAERRPHGADDDAARRHQRRNDISFVTRARTRRSAR